MPMAEDLDFRCNNKRQVPRLTSSSKWVGETDYGEPNSTPNKDNDNDDEKWNISAGDIYTWLVMVMMIWCDRVSVLIYIPS